MATTISTFSQPFTIAALDTYNYTIRTAGVHRVQVRLTDVTGLSGLTLTIKNNSSTLATAAGITGNSSGVDLNLQTLANFAVNDVLGIVITSSAASDAAPNQIKGYVTLNLSS